MVTLKAHYVKPQPTDLAETILTDECKEETGLDENAVRNGQPLDFVLEEVSQGLASLETHTFLEPLFYY